MVENIKYCKCGCGEIVQKNYRRGHGRRGKKNSKEQNEKIGIINKEKNKGQIAWNKGVIGVFKHSEETKQKISKTCKEKNVGNWLIGMEIKDSTRKKISDSNKGRACTDATKEKISIKNSGENNGMYGKTHSDEYKDRLRLNIEKFTKNAHSIESIEKMRTKKMGMKVSDETRTKMRLSKIEYIKNKNGGVRPMHNINACKYFDKLSESKNWKLQHALNGGEFYVSELGYFVDAYDSVNNIVIEYDEPKHYHSSGILKNKDVIRQNQIIDKLNCNFFRYNEKKDELYEIVHI